MFILGSYGDTLTVSGDGFDISDENNVVKLIHTTKELECIITSSSANSLSCTIPAGAPATYTLEVYVKPKGIAKSSTPLTFDLTAEITDITPTSSYLGGIIFVIFPIKAII